MSNFNVLDRVIGLLVEAYEDRFKSPDEHRKPIERRMRAGLDSDIKNAHWSLHGEKHDSSNVTDPGYRQPYRKPIGVYGDESQARVDKALSVIRGGSEKEIGRVGASAAEDRSRRLKAGAEASAKVNKNPLTRLGRAIAKNKLVRGIRRATGFGPRKPRSISGFTNKIVGEKPMQEAFINKTISILVERRMNKSKKSSYKNKSC